MKTSLPFTFTAALSLAVSVHAQTYSVTDLVALNGAPTYPTTIHENGRIAGHSQPTETSARSSALAKQPTPLIP